MRSSGRRREGRLGEADDADVHLRFLNASVRGEGKDMEGGTHDWEEEGDFAERSRMRGMAGRRWMRGVRGALEERRGGTDEDAEG